jgi:hypothetical protein
LFFRFAEFPKVFTEDCLLALFAANICRFFEKLLSNGVLEIGLVCSVSLIFSAVGVLDLILIKDNFSGVMQEDILSFWILSDLIDKLSLTIKFLFEVLELRFKSPGLFIYIIEFY